MATSLVLQNFFGTRDEAAERGMLLRAAAVARAQAVLADAERSLAALSSLPGVTNGQPEECRTSLRAGGPVATSVLEWAVFLGPDAILRCSLGDAVPDAIRQAEAAPAGQTLVFASAAAGRHTMLVRLPLASGVAVGSLRLDRLAWSDPATPVGIWLGDGLSLVRLSSDDAVPAPASALLGELASSPDAIGTQRGFVYTAAPLVGSVRLVLGYDATAEREKASRVLVNQLLQLLLLVALGLGALLVGTGRAVVAPLRGLGQAVGGWRARGAYRPPSDTLPTEIQALSDSFRSATAALSAREAELQRAVEQQELAMQEIHHRVKNNLQIVASLLNLQASRIRQPEARAEFQSARDRVRALATLHRHLYAHGEVHSINMREFLVELCGQLFQAMGEREGHRIALHIEAPELNMSSDQAVPLALIVTEAVSNALKYAFPAGRTGEVGVTLSAQDDEATLVVEDNGVGLPQGPTETETGTRDGIGLQLIRGFARQLGGRLSVEEGAGTRYVVVMQLQRQRQRSLMPG